MDVSGIAAVLDRPMRDRPILFTDPGILLPGDDPRITRDGRPVGAVTRAWIDGDLLRWEGHLTQPPLQWDDRCVDAAAPAEAPCWEIPLPSPLVLDIARGDLVGVVDLTRGEMTTRNRVTTISRWSIASIALLPYRARPWDELVLRPARKSAAR